MIVLERSVKCMDAMASTSIQQTVSTSSRNPEATVTAKIIISLSNYYPNRVAPFI